MFALFSPSTPGRTIVDIAVSCALPGIQEHRRASEAVPHLHWVRASLWAAVHRREGSRFPASAPWVSHGLVPSRAKFQNPWERGALGGDPSLSTATELCERLSAALLSHAVTAQGRQPSPGSHSCLPLQHLLPTDTLGFGCCHEVQERVPGQEPACACWFCLVTVDGQGAAFTWCGSCLFCLCSFVREGQRATASLPKRVLRHSLTVCPLRKKAGQWECK